MDTQKTINHITDWMKNYLKESQQNGFVIGVSGGIDSAVTSTLCATTGKPTLCVELPIHQHKSEVSRARKHIDHLEGRFGNVTSVKVDLSNTFDTFKSSLPEIENKDVQDFSLANARARLRMTTLYYFAGIHGYLVAGTGNKVEDFGVGFYTKYGDGGVDLSPIADLMKSEVYELAKSLSVIDEIQDAEPTDGLHGDHRTDEDQIGASYDELEWAMEFNGEISDISDRQQEVLKIYNSYNKANQHKMQPIPVCEIPDEYKA